MCTKWSLRVWYSRWGVCPMRSDDHVVMTLIRIHFRLPSTYEDPWPGSASRRRRGWEKWMPWYGFPISDIFELLVSNDMCLYSVRLWTQSPFPFPWTWVRIALEPCKAERIHKIGNSLGFYISPHVVDYFQVLQVPRRVRIKLFDYPYFLDSDGWHSFRCLVFWDHYSDLVLRNSETSYVYYILDM